jgi:PKD repeat protein
MNNLNHCRPLAGRLFTASLLVISAGGGLAAVRFVDVNSANPTPPYSNWATAATNIQAAVDAAVAGDEIVVTNGIYSNGGRALDGYNTNRVLVDKPLALRSVNGPQFTVIDGGYWDRCVYLTNGANLSGFTLTNGGGVCIDNGGGVFCASVTATVSNCVVEGNSAGLGGGVYGGTLNNCILSGNQALGYGDDNVYGSGGGACSSVLDNCTLNGNSAYDDSGGASGCTLNNCTLSGNQGRGADGSTLNNCALTGNSSGAYSSTLNNCTLTGNSGWGASASTLNNCIVYFNTLNYDLPSTLTYCCTTPQPTKGVGNISLNPQLASASHLSASSPCRGAGNAAYATGTDIDGEAWASPPSIGCDEYHAGAVTGPLDVGIKTSFTYVRIGYAMEFEALIEGRTTASSWDFGDGTSVTNLPYASHAWTAPGDYAVVLRAYNETQPGGISATVTVRVLTQPVHYVAATNANPLAPYVTWATAATNIQQALDSAAPEAVVLVADGIYTSISVQRPLSLRSLHGPQFTVIDGGSSTRCVYLADGAGISGFTLTNGFAVPYGGGLFCETTNSFASNCVISGNSSRGEDAFGFYLRAAGGGVAGGTLNNCILSHNSVKGGFVGEPSYNQGGGASGATLNNCTLIGNAADVGAGASYCILNNCAISGNSGSGADNSTLNNCTLTGNSGGGAYGSTLNNCVIYFNTAQHAANYDSYSTLNYCCTMPLPAKGVGNISADPQLASASHLSADSTCRGAGRSAYSTGTDIDGEPWANPPSIGCEEYHAGAHTGPLGVGISASFTNVAVGFAVQFTGLIDGHPTDSVWEFGDGVVEINEPYTSHAWATPGDYRVALWGFNDSHPEGLSATVTIHVVSGLHYVDTGSKNPVAPYVSWATAAANIQDAVDAATVPGAVVLVTNGSYATGWRVVYVENPGILETNRLAVDKPLTLRSVNGPQFTTIDGGQSVRCVYLSGGASLSGFTLTNGAGSWSGVPYVGAGVWCESTGEVVSNCVVAGNRGLFGGGTFSGTLNNCVLSGNLASSGGGGAYGSILNNCIVYANTASQWPNYDYPTTTLNYCCTTPQPTNGVGNITNPPLFVDQAGGDLRLQSNSPCINAGNNIYAVSPTDLEGNPRIAGGTVDIGAYEFQSPTSVISYAWLQQYGLPTDGSADYSDPDGDGMNNWQEWRCGTDPTNALSVLRLLAPMTTGTHVTVTWQSVAGVTYFLERSTNLAPTSTFGAMTTNIPGQPGTTTYRDTNAVGAGPFFYRVGVGN